jgi:LEA14-like dessication related protein
MNRRYLVLLLLGLGLFFPSACSNPGKIIVTGLKVELTGIDRAGDGAVTVHWRMVNPNVTPYLLSRVNSRIYLDGALIGKTADGAPMAVPAEANAAKSSTLETGGTDGGRIIGEAAARGSAGYRVDSEVTVLIYGDTTQNGVLTSSGTVPVTAK